MPAASKLNGFRQSLPTLGYLHFHLLEGGSQVFIHQRIWLMQSGDRNFSNSFDYTLVYNF
jgi:hypothetical protein